MFRDEKGRRKPLILVLLDLPLRLLHFLVIRLLGTTIAFPVYVFLFLLEFALFLPLTGVFSRVALAPLRFVLALIPPLLYVAYPTAPALYLLYLMHYQRDLHLGYTIPSVVIVFLFLFFLLCVRVKKLSAERFLRVSLRNNKQYRNELVDNTLLVLALLFLVVAVVTLFGIRYIVLSARAKPSEPQTEDPQIERKPTELELKEVEDEKEPPQKEVAAVVEEHKIPEENKQVDQNQEDSAAATGGPRKKKASVVLKEFATVSALSLTDVFTFLVCYPVLIVFPWRLVALRAKLREIKEETFLRQWVEERGTVIVQAF